MIGFPFRVASYEYKWGGCLDFRAHVITKVHAHLPLPMPKQLTKSEIKRQDLISCA